MALGIAIVKKNTAGAAHHVIADVTFDNSYLTGGEPLLPAALGLSSMNWVQAQQKGVGTRICEYDYVNQTLMLFTALGTQAGSGSDQSTIVVRVHASGDNTLG